MFLPGIIPLLKNRTFRIVLSDILSSAKALEVLTFASLSPSFLTVWTVCENPLPSSKVAADFNGASLWVSVLPLHASLSACDRDSPSSISCLIGIQRHSQPCKEVLSDQSIARDFIARLSSRFHEIVFVPSTSWIVLPYNFAIHLLSEGRSFPAQMIVNTFPAFITFEYFIEHPLSEIAMSRRHYGCFLINLQGMVYCKNMI